MDYSIKKKKKKSFLKKTIKYGNKSRGTYINDETFQYFLHIMKVSVHEFKTDQEKEMFAENVFEQLSGNEVSYSSNQMISLVIEKLLPLISDKTLSTFVTIFSKDLRPICDDPFASFVLQKLIIICTKRLENCNKMNDEDVSNDTLELHNFYRNWIIRIGKFLTNNLEDFVSNPHANPVIRTALVCLAGIPDLNIKMLETKCNEIIREDVQFDEDFLTIINNCVNQFMSWLQFSELPFNVLASGLLQVLLYVTSIVDGKKLKIISSKLVDECFIKNLQLPDDITKEHKKIKLDNTDDDEILVPHIFENDSSSRLLEMVIALSPLELWIQIYENIFINGLLRLSKHHKANHSVQKLIMCCREKAEFESICDELFPNIEEILLCGHTGVILELCRGCKRLKTKQSQFIQCWMNCLKCNDPQYEYLIVLSTIYLKKDFGKDGIDKDGSESNNMVHKVTIYGSLLVQTMLHFNKPIKIINSFLEIESNKLVDILCDTRGCHIADALFNSEYVGEKSKEKFMKKIQGFYSRLCCSKYGSRVFDIIWRTAILKNKISIITELRDHQSELESSQFGQCIARNISLNTFRRKKEDWIKAQNTNSKVENLFSDIL